MLTILYFCENPWLVRTNPQTWNTTGNGDWFPITGVRCGSGYVVLGGSSQGGVQKLDLTPVSSGGIAVRVALQPISDMALDTVLPRINVEVPCERTKSYSDSSVSSPTLKCCLGKKAEQFCWQTIKHINENRKILCSSFLSGVVDPRYYWRRTRFFCQFFFETTWTFSEVLVCCAHCIKSPNGVTNKLKIQKVVKFCLFSNFPDLTSDVNLERRFGAPPGANSIQSGLSPSIPMCTTWWAIGSFCPLTVS